MSDEGLVEALARRLLDLYAGPPMTGRTRLGFVSEDAEESFKRMARECVRQMEWTRTGASQIMKDDNSGIEYRVYTDGELTLAPEGWTP